MFANNGTDHNITNAVILEYVEFRIVRISLYVLIFLLSCIGNSLAAIVITKAKGMWTSANMLILNLALCDLLLPVLSIPFDLAFEELNYVWPFGRGMCKVLWPLQTTISTSSSLTLAAISLDRFRTLRNPFVRRASTGRILVFLSIIHVVSITLCIPYFIALDYNALERSCGESWPSFGYRQAYTVVLFLCQYALPLVTMSIAYLLIYRSLRSNTTRLFATNSTRQSGQTNSNRLSTFSMDEMEFKRKEQNIRLAKMFVFVVVVFAISMFPNQVLWLWVDFGNGAVHSSFHYISVICRLCTYANNFLNPFIYALKSREFRSGFARIGRKTVMQPLRKISSETRKIARKVSRSVLDNPHSNSAVSAKSAPPSPLEVIEEDLSKTVRFDLSDESFSHQNSTPRTPTRKNSCYDARCPSSKPSFAESGVPLIQNGTVQYAWVEKGKHCDEIALGDYLSGIDVLNSDKFNNKKTNNVMAVSTETTRAGFKLYKLIQELPETDC